MRCVRGQFYIFDKPVEVLARHLLLTSIAFEWELPVRQRSTLYLEVFGNCLVQVRGCVGRGAVVLRWLVCALAMHELLLLLLPC